MILQLVQVTILQQYRGLQFTIITMILTMLLELLQYKDVVTDL
jgi:hypothetical protein